MPLKLARFERMLFQRQGYLAGLRQIGWSASVMALGGAMLATAAGSANASLLAQTSSGSQSSQSIPTTPPPDARFTCEFENGEYVVKYHPLSQPGESYAWARPTELGGGWTEDRRCYEISRRLESYRPDGLVEMRTSVENGYDIVCVTTEANPSCRIVFTVPPGQDPIVTRDRVFSNLTTADSGQSTQAVTTYRGDGGEGIISQIGEAVGVDLSSILGNRRTTTPNTTTRNTTAPNNRSSAIDLRPFLDPADGGTGERL